MTEPDSSFDAVEVARALGWDEARLELLLEDRALQREVRDVCVMGTELRVEADVSPAMVARLTDSLRREGAAPQIGGRSGERLVSEGRFAWDQGLGIVLASVFATFATFFTLMSTGAWGGGNMLPQLAVSLLAGMVVAFHELTNSDAVGRLSVPNGRQVSRR